jgi:tetratricopeptide (TPR) repeat protein
MSKREFFGIFFILAVLFSAVGSGQTPTDKDTGGHDFSKEGALIEQMTTKVVFQSEGTYTYDQHSRVKVQSDAGVRQYGILPFSYQSSVGHVEVRDVHVTKPDGSVVSTPLDSIQDVTSALFRDAPLHSDLREKHVAVKGLEPGDTLEYSVRWQIEKPLAKGQFWTGYQFAKNLVVLDEQLEISVPAEREVKLKSKTVQPTTHLENGRRIYKWKTSNLQSLSFEEQKKVQTYDAIRGLLPPPDVLISSFRNWEQVGRWYEALQREKIQPSPEVKAKALELTKGLLNDDAKIRAIYNYVSLRYRYVAISFGIGRYQPHAATEIIGNQYGDCKDKHTLLAALLNAIGIKAYPALINAAAAVDDDVPSPGQFNHVISVVSQGGTLSWMDTTPEVTAMGFLVYSLRGKPGLVIMPEKVAFQTTPTDPPFANKHTAALTAKLDPDGTLRAHAVTTDRGDYEVYDRSSFRRWPESQWADLVRKTSQAGQCGATISNVRVTQPEKTEEPFTLEYDYTLKDFAEGEKRRFAVPLPGLNIPLVSDQDLTRQTPLWLGYGGDEEYDSKIELPAGWYTTTPKPLDLKESFAEYQGNSEVQQSVLITKRHLLLKATAVAPDQIKSYRAFQKATSDDHATYILLSVSPNLASSSHTKSLTWVDRQNEVLRESIKQLPGSSDSQALQAEQNARKSMTGKDYTTAVTALKYAVSLDDKFSRAWVELGVMYSLNKESASSLNALQKAVSADPKQVAPYKILALDYMSRGKQDSAIATWQSLQSIAPDDPDLAFYLGVLYAERKRYAEAIPLIESAIKSNPSDAYAQMTLGTLRLRSHDVDHGLEAIHKALEIDSGAMILNNAAWEMAETSTNLAEALGYSQKSVKEVEEQSQKVDPEHITKADLQLVPNICASWDTLGWIYFKMGDFARAESYLSSAWQVSEDGPTGDHLGQVYERQNKLPAALHMYNLALTIDPRLEGTPAREHNLAHIRLPKNQINAEQELRLMRTVKLSAITKETASADFDVLFGVDGKIQKVNFSSGSELLRHAGDTLEKMKFEEPLPSGSNMRLLRRGILSCLSGECSFVLNPLAQIAPAN